MRICACLHWIVEMFVLLPHLSSCPTLMGNTEVMQGTEGWHPAAVGLVWNHKGPKSWPPTEWSSMLPLVPTGEGVIKAKKRKKNSLLLPDQNHREQHRN